MDGEDTREEEYTKKLFEDDFINHSEEKQRKYEKNFNPRGEYKMPRVV